MNTIIKLDLDDICFAALESRVEFFKKYSWCSEIICYESPRMGGYHVYLKSNRKLTDRATYQIRYECNDDPKRLIRDMLDIGENLLFGYKLEKSGKHKYLWQSTELFKWIKLNENSWQKIQNHEPKVESLKKCKQESQQELQS